MPVEANTFEYTYIGDGVAVEFQFPSRFLSSDDLIVSIDGAEQSQSTYIVVGAGAANGGYITFLTPPSNGTSVLILRKPAASQLTDFVNGQTVLEGTLDNALDRLTMVDQYALRTLTRTVRLGDLDESTDMTLPAKAFRSSKVFGFDINGAPEARDPYDMRSSRVTNVAAPTDLTDAVRLQDLNSRFAAAGNVPPPVFSQIGFFLKATAVNTFGWVAQTLGALAAKNTIAAGDIDAGAVLPSKLSTGGPSWGASGNLSFNSGYGSVATAYGCRAWVGFNGTGTVAIRASGNVTSITDNGTGDYTINFMTPMTDANYSTVFGSAVSFNQANGDQGFANLQSNNGGANPQTTGGVRINASSKASSIGVNVDGEMINVAIFR